MAVSPVFLPGASTNARLIDIKPGANTTRALLTLEIQEESKHTQIRLDVSITELERALYGPGVIDAQVLNALRTGNTIDSAVLARLDASNVILEIPIAASVLKSGATVSLPDNLHLIYRTDLGTPSPSATITKKLGQGQSSPWPDPPKEPGFTPISNTFKPEDLEKGFTRIGYATIKSPIQAISYSRNTRIQTQPMLREASTMKKGTGFSYETYHLSYSCTGADEIYSGIKEVIEQIALMPFLSVEGGPFGAANTEGDIAHKAVTIRNFTLSTIPGFPNSLQVDLQVDPFVWHYYVPFQGGKYPVMDYDDAICWPLIKLWCKTRDRSKYDGKPFNGQLSMSFPSPETASLLYDLLGQPELDQGLSEDINSLTTLRDGLLGSNRDTSAITSSKVKEIVDITQNLNSNRIFVLKVNNKEIWDQFVSETTIEQGDINYETPLNLSADLGSVNFIGLIDWNKRLASRNFAEDGQYNPRSAIVPISYLQESWSSNMVTSTVVGSASGSPLNWIDAYKGSLAAQIESSYLQANPTIPSTDVNAIEEVYRRRTEPWKYYGIVIQATSDSRDLRDKISRVISKYQDKATVKYKNIKDALVEEYVPDTDATSIVLDLNISEQLLVESISGTKSHNIGIKSFFGNPLPLHECLGGNDTLFIVQGKAFGSEAKQKLIDFKEEYDRRAINKHSRKFLANSQKNKNQLYSVFTRVENEIFQLMGVDFVMPMNLDISTIEGQPGVWEFSITFVEYNPATLEAEQIRYMPTTSDQIGRAFQYGWNFDVDQPESNPIFRKALELKSLEYYLSLQEVYPDLYLPTYGELQYWLSACKKLARQYEGIKDGEARKKFITEGIITSTKSTAPNTSISEDQKRILNIVKDYFYDMDHVRSMAAWNVKDTPASIRQFAGRVDPDFFVYYNPKNSWPYIFDSLSKDLMGKPDELQATGQPTGGIPDRLRLVDNSQGALIGSVSNTDFYQTTGDRIGSNVQSFYDQSYSLDPEQPNAAEDLKKASIAAGERMDSLAGTGKWWGRQQTFSVADQNNPKHITLDPNQESEFYRGDQTKGRGISSDFQDDLVNGNLTAGEASSSDFVATYDQLGWRQALAKEMASFGSSRSRKFEEINDLTLHSFLLKKGSIVEEFERNELLKNADQADIERALKDLSQTLAMGDTPNPEQSSGLSGAILFTNLLERPNYIIQTIRANASYSFWKGRAAPEPSITNNAEGNTKATFDLFDSVAALNNLDPNLLRCVFLRRDGMGAYKTQSSTEDNGFGDLADSFVIQQGLQKASISDRVKAVAARLSNLMATYNNVPSVALMALDMEIDSKSRSLYLDGQSRMKPDVAESLQAAANQVANARFSPAAGAAIRSLTNKYSSTGAQVNEYFTAYIKLNRTLGSYQISNTLNIYDPYFYPFSPLIMADLGDNVKAYLTTHFSPTGEETVLDLDRSTITGLVASVQQQVDNDLHFNPDSSSLDLQIKLGKKLRAAMDPHSEAAIYGCLVDLRTYSQFGRLVGAFPAYNIILINEGFYWAGGVQKLWDQYYTRTGVAEISVLRSRLEPADVCNIVLSNQFYDITAYAEMEVLQQAIAEANNRKVIDFTLNLANPLQAISNLRQLWEIMTKQLSKEGLSAWQNNHLKRLALGVGTRLHVRLGYGSNAAKLPVVFNGSIISIPAEDGHVMISAVGDGYELNKNTTTSLTKVSNSYAFQDGASFGQGKDPAQIITEAVVGSSLWDNITQGLTRDKSNGVVHYGEIYYQGIIHYPTELQINIYSSNNTTLEQRVPMIAGYFNINALYNFNDSNLFSVEVHEPTLWKIMQVCRRACLDFVASSEYFTTRSTIFFGKWWWPYNYDYSESIIDLENASKLNIKGIPTGQSARSSQTINITGENPLSGQDKMGTGGSLNGAPVTEGDIDGLFGFFGELLKASGLPGYIVNSALNATPTTIPGQLPTDITVSLGVDLLKDVYNLTEHLKWKTYMQAYFAHSMINLLENNIEANANAVFTDAQGTHKYNGVLSPESINKTITFSVDSDIIPADRKTMMVDSGLLVTWTQNPGKAIAEGITTSGKFLPIPVISQVIGGINDYINETPSTPAVNNAVVSALIDSVKEMYQGTIVMAGQPTIKPRDLILMTDHKHDMAGPIFVKEVTHRLDSQNGLITIISPDCVAYPHGSEFGHQLVMSLSTGILHRIGAFYTYRAATAATLGEIVRLKQRQMALAVRTNIDAYDKALEATRKSDQPLTSTQHELLRIEDEAVKAQSKTIRNARAAGFSEKEAQAAGLKRANNIRETFYLNDANRTVMDGLAGVEVGDEDFAKLLLSKQNKEALVVQYRSRLDSIKKTLNTAKDETTLKKYQTALARTEERLEKAEAELKEANKAIRKFVENLRVTRQEADNFVRWIVRKSSSFKTFILGGGELETDSLVARVLKDTVGGTVEAAEAVGRGGGLLLNQALTTAKDARKSAGQPTGYRKMLNFLSSAKDELRDFNTAREGIKETKALIKSYKTTKLAIETLNRMRKTFSVALYAGPQGLLKVAFDLSVMIIGGQVIEGINARWKARQVAKIVPLTVGGHPYVAGIRGHAGAVVGDNPGWFDTVVYNQLGLSNPSTEEGGSTALGGNALFAIASFIGIELPEYSTNELEDLYARQYQYAEGKPGAQTKPSTSTSGGTVNTPPIDTKP